MIVIQNKFLLLFYLDEVFVRKLVHRNETWTVPGLFTCVSGSQRFV